MLHAARRLIRALGVTLMSGVADIMSPTLDPVRLVPPMPPHTYLGIAVSLLSGIHVLAAASGPVALPLSMLCAHALECTLKGYLSRDGDDSRVKQPSVRHNLLALWSLAHAEGLHIPAAPPSWVSCLSGLHDRPYYLRYSTGVHGIVMPGAQPMVQELEALLGQVQDQLQ